MEITNYELHFLEENRTIVGVDEVGRGSVFGPLAVGAVLIDDFIVKEQVNDSKKLTKKTREKIVSDLKNKVKWKVEFSFPEKSLNKSLNECCQKISEWVNENVLYKRKIFILTDFGLKRFFNKFDNVHEFEKADSTYFSVALASVFAKVERDNYICKLSETEKYSYYFLKDNKGYLTENHKEALKKYGLSDLHRTFYKNMKQFIRGENMEKLLLFTSKNCPTCSPVKKQLLDHVNKSKKKISIEVKNIDEKEDAKLAAKYSVMGLPTVVHLINNSPCNSFTGSNIISSLIGKSII